MFILQIKAFKKLFQNEVKWQKMEMEARQSSKNLKTAVYAIPEAIFLKTFLFINIPKVFFPKYFVNLSI